MKRPVVYIFILIWLCGGRIHAVETSEIVCFRHAVNFQFHHQTISLVFISEVVQAVEELYQKGLISKTAHGTLITEATNISLNVCETGAYRLDKQDEVISQRPALVTAGSLILGPTLGNIFANNDKAKEVTIFRTKLENIMKETEKKENFFKKETKEMKRKQEVLMHLNNVAESFQVMKLQFDDFRSSPSNRATNVVIKKVLKHTMKVYKKMALIPKTTQINLEDKILLPNGTFHIQFTAFKDRDCKKARFDIKALSLLPTQQCATLHASTADYTSVETANECHYIGPIQEGIRMSDKSLMLPTGAYTIPGKCPEKPQMSFRFINGSLFITPHNDKASTIIVCSGRLIKRAQLDMKYAYSTPASCYAYWANSQEITNIDLKSNSWGGVDADGRQLHQGNKVKEEEILLYHPIAALMDKNKPDNTPHLLGKKSKNGFEHFDCMLLAGAGITLLVLTTISGVTAIVYIIVKRRKKQYSIRALYRRNQDETLYIQEYSQKRGEDDDYFNDKTTDTSRLKEGGISE